MVFTRLPATVTGRRLPPGFCARAASSIPQLQKAMPVAAAPLSTFRRVVIAIPPLRSASDLDATSDSFERRDRAHPGDDRVEVGIVHPAEIDLPRHRQL